MCYIGKATKIFIFFIAVIVVTGLVIGFSIVSRNIHPKSHKCSGDYCSLSNYSPPPPLQFPIPSLPDPGASNPSDPTVNSNAPPPPPPPPETSLPKSPPETSQPPPSPETSLPPPPSASLTNPSPPPNPTSPPISVAPPTVGTAPPPQAFSPPSPVQVSPGPVNSS